MQELEHLSLKEALRLLAEIFRIHQVPPIAFLIPPRHLSLQKVQYMENAPAVSLFFYIPSSQKNPASNLSDLKNSHLYRLQFLRLDGIHINASSQVFHF